MRKLLLLLVVVACLVVGAFPAMAGNGAEVDRAGDCWFPGAPPPLFEATDLRIQKVRNSGDVAQFHCHGVIDDLSQAPAAAFRVEGACFLPPWFGWTPGEGKAVVTPNGTINLTCRFHR